MRAWIATLSQSEQLYNDRRKIFIFIRTACTMVQFIKLVVFTKDVSVSSITAELSVSTYSHYYLCVTFFFRIHKCTYTGWEKYLFNKALCPESSLKQTLLKKRTEVVAGLVAGLFFQQHPF